VNPSEAARPPATHVRDRTVVELISPLGRLRRLVDELVAAGMSPSTMVVAMALASHCDPAGVAYRSVRGLARSLERGPGEVARDMARLRRAGLVEVVVDHKGRRHRRGYLFPAMSMYR